MTDRSAAFARAMLDLDPGAGDFPRLEDLLLDQLGVAASGARLPGSPPY